MYKILVVVPISIHCAPCEAQSYTVLPSAYTSYEGESYSGAFGVYPSQRLQWAEGELGATPRVLKGFGMRVDSSIPRTSNGRSFNNVSVELADTDYRTLSATFSANASNTPTRVFSAAVTLPTIASSSSGPAPWDRRVAIAFTSPFVYAGLDDVLLDMWFTGGQLMNQQPWSSRSFLGYYFDTAHVGSAARGVMTLHGGSGSGSGCSDRGHSSHYGAYSYLECVVYGPTYLTATYRDKMQISFQCLRAGPNATIAHALSAFGRSAGTVFPGVTCNRVFLDLARPVLLYFRQANALGDSGRVWAGGSAPDYLLPYAVRTVGTPLWYQAAWHDTRDGRLLLTRAVENFIPRLPMASLQRAAVYHDEDFRAIGYGPFASPYYFPIVRYAH